MIKTALYVIAVIVELALTLGFATFCLLFHVLADWRATSMGRLWMTFMGSITIILLFGWVNLVFHMPFWLNASLQLPVYIVLAFAVWRQVGMLIRIQKQARLKTIAHFWSQDE